MSPRFIRNLQHPDSFPKKAWAIFNRPQRPSSLHSRTNLDFIPGAQHQNLLSFHRKHRNFTIAMASRDSAHVEITPEVLLKAYACGIFPMAESAEDPALYWIEPELRG